MNIGPGIWPENSRYQWAKAADLHAKSPVFDVCRDNPSLSWLHKVYSLLYVIIQEIIMGPPSRLRSPVRSSQTWWIRSCLTRNSTRRSSENAQPPSARWTEKTAQLQTKRRKRRSPRWLMVWPVRNGACNYHPSFPDVVFCLFNLYFMWCRRSLENTKQQGPHFHSDHSVPQQTFPGLAFPHTRSALNHKCKAKTWQRPRARESGTSSRVPSRFSDITALWWRETGDY